MSGTVEEISSVIRSIVASGGQLPGSRVSTALRERVPGWDPGDFGARSLREFIAANVQGVVVVGRAGMDVIYGLEGAEAAPPDTAPLPTSQPDFWRIWVSPNSPFVLVIDHASAALTVAARGTLATEGQVLLEPPSSQVHRSIAREFLTKASDEELRARLQVTLDRSLDNWWQSWLRELRGSPLLATWNAFRREQFENRLRSQLRAATMSESSIDRVIAVIRERHIEAPPRPRRSLQQMSVARTDDAVLRRVVLEAVQRMSAAELRDLRLPLGVVLDVVASSKSR